MCIALPAPVATLFCYSVNRMGWTVLFLGTMRGGGVARGMAITSRDGLDAAALAGLSEDERQMGGDRQWQFTSLTNQLKHGGET